MRELRRSNIKWRSVLNTATQMKFFHMLFAFFFIGKVTSCSRWSLFNHESQRKQVQLFFNWDNKKHVVQPRSRSVPWKERVSWRYSQVTIFCLTLFDSYSYDGVSVGIWVIHTYRWQIRGGSVSKILMVMVVDDVRDGGADGGWPPW